jgi:hypothetical protein
MVWGRHLDQVANAVIEALALPQTFSPWRWRRGMAWGPIMCSW